MEIIKSFIYVDEYRMYSISSQIFEGITEHLVSYHGTKKEIEEEQKGPIGSGRVLADILISGSGTQEKKYLHDYSYKLFEDHLMAEDRVLNIDASNIDTAINNIDSRSFVKVKARAIFNDINMIKTTTERFNELGEAIAYITNYSDINEVKKQLETAEAAIGDKNQKAKLRHKLKEITDIGTIAKLNGLTHDKKFLEKLRLILEYGFQDQFEVQMTIGEHLFSANIKREYLRENEQILVRKYSRQAEKDFVLFGTIAQSSKQVTEPNRKETVTTSPQPHMKQAIMNLVDALSNVESTFTGRLSNEIIIDPIAIYREL